jgi:hypothetical protein
MAKCYEYLIKVTRDVMGERRESKRVVVRERMAATHVVLAEVAKLSNYDGGLIGVELVGMVPREWGKPAGVRALRVDALRDGAADGGGC